MKEIILNYKELGLRIRKMRISKAMTQIDVAKATGLSTQHISNIETSKSKVSLDKLVSIANVLDCSMDELLCDSLPAKRGKYAFSKEIVALINSLNDTQLKILPDFMENYIKLTNSVEKEYEILKFNENKNDQKEKH